MAPVRTKKPQVMVARTAKRAAGGQPRLSQHALAWARLLKDPCAANVAHPCYGGSESGYLVRTKYSGTILGGNTNGIYQITPGLGMLTGAAFVGGNTSTSGTALTLSPVAASTFAPFLANNARAWRAVAACVKVRYTGAESARAGMVGLKYTTAPPYKDNTTSIILDQELATCPVVQRLGEVEHEIKWVPADTDELYLNTASSVLSAVGGTLSVIITGAPASSVFFETTVVYEWLPFSSLNVSVGAGLPPSTNTTAEVIRSIGPTLRWLYGNVVSPVIKSLRTDQVYSLGWRDEL